MDPTIRPPILFTCEMVSEVISKMTMVKSMHLWELLLKRYVVKALEIMIMSSS